MFNFNKNSLDAFLKFYKPIGNNLDYNQVMQFKALDNDEARFRFIYNCKGSKVLKLKEKQINKKDKVIALALKNKGNTQFLAKHWNAALEMYNQSYHATPTENIKDISIILANRSAVLYHLEMFDLAINDIKLAMPNYPKELMYKIKERKAKCLLAKQELHQALQYFQETIGCLDDSDLPDDKRRKFQQSNQTKIDKLLNELKKPNKETDISNNNELNDKNVLHESVKFVYNDTEGNFPIAKEEIQIGEQILVQQAHGFWLSEEYCKSNCQHCFKKTVAPLPCPSCSNVVFCSKDCRDVALASYHKYECAIFPFLSILGKSCPCYLALRMITQKNLNYFLNLKDELKNRITLEDTLKLPSNDYRKVFNLIRHEKKCDVYAYLTVCSISKFLCYCLKLSGYFESDNEDDFYYIGGLITRNILIVRYNGHGIYELQGLTKITIGSGIYPTFALFNHSCNPNIFRYFKGTTVVVNSTKTTKAGDMIADCYGPIYIEHSNNERFEYLNTHYLFKCNCLACKEKWPVLKKMDDLRFKCAGNKPCNNIVNVSIRNCDGNFMFKCKSCKQFTNITKEFEALQEAIILLKDATKYFKNNGNRTIMHKSLTNADKFLVPPSIAYAEFQQSVENCLAQLGNKCK